MQLSRFQIVSIFFVILLIHVVAGIYFSGYTWWHIVACIILYIAILALGSIFIRFSFYIKSQNRLPLIQLKFDGGQFQMDATSKRVALTFDDGPATYTGQILDILQKEKIPATFFLIGKNIAGNESLAKRMTDEGHSIGNHSYFHGFNFDWQSTLKMVAEIEQTNAAIKGVTGVETAIFRPPYGVTTPNLAKAIKHCNMKSIGWSLRSMDTVAKDADKLLQKILNSVKAGDIILLHDSCAITLAILPQLIAQLKERNFIFERIM